MSQHHPVCLYDKVLKEKLRNDFEAVVFRNYPDIGNIKKKMYESGAVFAQLSGSGSTVFGFYTDNSMCEKAGEMFADYQSFICPPIR